MKLEKSTNGPKKFSRLFWYGNWKKASTKASPEHVALEPPDLPNSTAFQSAS
jgi:hypothetical protein